MSPLAISVFSTLGIAALICSAVLHAMIAAFEQLPDEAERRIAEGRRGDGRRTAAARLSAEPERSSNNAAVSYVIAEAVMAVSVLSLTTHLANEAGWRWWTGAVASAAVATFLSLVLVRSLPRDIARANPESTLRGVAPVALALILLAAPARVLAPALRVRPLAEASDLIEQAEDSLDEDDIELLRSVVGLGETLVREVMVPRTDMVTIRAGVSARKAMVLFMRSGFSRVPVIGDNVDDMVGVLFLKDVIEATWDDPKALGKSIEPLVREPQFIPESVPVDDALRRMQAEVFHLAIVVDEFGGVAGLVTIEDALEEIVGEMVDEHDASTPEAVALPDGSYRVPARFPLDELGELFEIEIEDDEIETAAGMLAKALGKVPIPGSSAEAHGLVLRADRAEGRRRRLSSIIVTKVSQEGEHLNG